MWPDFVQGVLFRESKHESRTSSIILFALWNWNWENLCWIDLNQCSWNLPNSLHEKPSGLFYEMKIKTNKFCYAWDCNTTIHSFLSAFHAYLLQHATQTGKHCFLTRNTKHTPRTAGRSVSKMLSWPYSDLGHLYNSFRVKHDVFVSWSLIDGFIEYPGKTSRTWGINVTLQRVLLQVFEWNIWNCHDSNLKSPCLFKFAFIWHRKPGNREGLWENTIPSIIYLPYSCRGIKY